MPVRVETLSTKGQLAAFGKDRDRLPRSGVSQIWASAVRRCGGDGDTGLRQSQDHRPGPRRRTRRTERRRRRTTGVFTATLSGSAQTARPGVGVTRGRTPADGHRRELGRASPSSELTNTATSEYVLSTGFFITRAAVSLRVRANRDALAMATGARLSADWVRRRRAHAVDGSAAGPRPFIDASAGSGALRPNRGPTGRHWVGIPANTTPTAGKRRPPS